LRYTPREQQAYNQGHVDAMREYEFADIQRLKMIQSLIEQRNRLVEKVLELRGKR
jgi:transcriptional regulator of heat shock response